MYIYTLRVPLSQMYLRCMHIYVYALSLHCDAVKVMNRIHYMFQISSA